MNHSIAHLYETKEKAANFNRVFPRELSLVVCGTGAFELAFVLRHELVPRTAHDIADGKPFKPLRNPLYCYVRYHYMNIFFGN